MTEEISFIYSGELKANSQMIISFGDTTMGCLDYAIL